MRLVFRADGGATIGLGHVVRSLALASILNAQPTDCFLVRHPPEAVRGLIQEQGLALVELPELTYAQEAAYLADEFLQPTDIVVLDGYSFDSAYQRQLKASGCRLVCIDDLHQGSFVADLIINHSPGITESMYDALPSTRYCLGPEYSLLRPPFLQHSRLPQAPTAGITSVLLCFGGADPLRLTARCLTALLSQPSITKIGVLMGGASATIPEITALRHAYPRVEIQELRGLPAQEMVHALNQFTAVICPASTILIESLVVGKPAITGYYVANQQALAHYVHEQQQAYSVGSFPDLTDAELVMALQKGLHWLGHTTRQAYVARLQPEQLQREFNTLRSS